MQLRKAENTKQDWAHGYVLCCILIGMIFLFFPGWACNSLGNLLK